MWPMHLGLVSITVRGSKYMKKQKQKHSFNTSEYEPNFTNWDPQLVFKQSEACGLLSREIIKKSDKSFYPKPPIHKIGFIVGVLAMNEEIEIIVRFGDEIQQVIKAEFCTQYVLLPNF